jgi:hypothetical protein
MAEHRELTDRQLAARLRRAAAGGMSPREYCIRQKWAYTAIYARLSRAGLWNEVMTAKYAPQQDVAR